MNSAWTGAVNKVKVMNTLEQKERHAQEEKEERDKRELPRLNRTDSKVYVTDTTQYSPIDNELKRVDVLPEIGGSGQLYGIGERQEFIDSLETKMTWNTPRQNTVIWVN